MASHQPAGSAAERLDPGLPRHRGADGDHEDATRELAALLGPTSPTEWARAMAEVRPAAAELVERHRARIYVVARLLAQYGVLDGDRLHVALQ
jgi:hypothetical protein